MSEAPKEIMLTARVGRADLQVLETLAKSYGLNRSEALRRAIWQTASDRRLVEGAGAGQQAEAQYD